MKKEFYVGQPLIIKDTGEKVNFAYEDNGNYPCNIFGKEKGDVAVNYYKYEEVEPSTEFKFSEIIAGLEQEYFEVGTEFEIKGSPEHRIEVSKGMYGLFLLDAVYGEGVKINSEKITSTWTLVEPRKEMTLEEIEAELGYKIKLKDNI